MAKRKFSDVAGCSSWADREVIVLSDSEEEETETPAPMEEEVTYRDIYEVPAPPAPVIPTPMEEDADDEDPEEDPEWDEEAAAHDAAVLAEVDQQTEEPIWNAPEPPYDPAWEEPAPGEAEIPQDAAAMDTGIQDLPHPAFDFDAQMVVEIVQAAAADVQTAAVEAMAYQQIAMAEVQAAHQEIETMHQAAEIQAQTHEQEMAHVQGLLAAEQRRTARLTTYLDASRAIADSMEERLGRARYKCASSFHDLSEMIARFSSEPGMPSRFIDKGIVQQLIAATSERLLERL